MGCTVWILAQPNFFSLSAIYMSIDDSDDSKKMDQTWESPEVATVCKKLGLVAMRFVKDRYCSSHLRVEYSFSCNEYFKK